MHNVGKQCLQDVILVYDTESDILLVHFLTNMHIQHALTAVIALHNLLKC